MRFACEVSNVPENDWLAEDMAEREAKVQLHMEESSSEEEAGEDNDAY